MARRGKKSNIFWILFVIWLMAETGALSLLGEVLGGIISLLLLLALVVGGIALLKKLLKDKNGQDTSTMAQNEARSRVGSTSNANPYSSTMRYSASPAANTGSSGSTQKEQQKQAVDAQLSKRERKKIAKEAARKAAEEAELARARAAEAAKDEESRRKSEAARQAQADKKAREQSLTEKYGVTKRARTGDAAIDKMLDDEELAIAEMRRLDDNIEDEKMSAQIVHLEEVTERIVNYVVEHPDKKSQVRRFFNYYLPTSIKLLNSYDRMDDAGIAGTNIDGTKGQVEDMMDKALEAFDRQLDALYADEAMDVASEVKVMESLLNQEGLAGTDEIIQSQNG